MIKLSKAFIEGLKELGRNAILAVVPVLSIPLQSTIAGTPVNWHLILIVTLATLGLAVLNGINKWVHKSTATDLNGITPF